MATGLSSRSRKISLLLSFLTRYEDRLATLDEDGRGQLRSASGSGSAAFLRMPTQQDHRIEDPIFRIAVVRRLGGRVAAKAGPNAPRHCALVDKDGTVCGRPLDNGEST